MSVEDETVAVTGSRVSRSVDSLTPLDMYVSVAALWYMVGMVEKGRVYRSPSSTAFLKAVNGNKAVPLLCQDTVDSVIFVNLAGHSDR